MRMIDLPNVVECLGYPLGAIQAPQEVYRDGSSGNMYAYQDGRVFDVHPLDGAVNGYPIRWELGDTAKAKLADHRAFWKEMGIE